MNATQSNGQEPFCDGGQVVKQQNGARGSKIFTTGKAMLRHMWK